MARTTWSTESELNIRDYVEYAKSHVGEVHDVLYMNNHVTAGHYEIIDFIESDEPKLVYNTEWAYDYKKHEQVPTAADVGYYIIRFIDTKYYKNRTLTFKITVSVQGRDWGTNEIYKTKAIFVSTKAEETQKWLKAYRFDCIDFEVRA